VVPYSPLGRGFLTGALPAAFADGDVRSRFPRFTGENARRNVALLEPVTAIATARSVTPAQIALAWLHQQAAVHTLTVVPIPGTRHPARLRQNLAALDLTVTSDELAQLEPIAAQVTGDRYPDMTETSNTRETR
jgi:aryl-alcohol dehydrogenase-like predicted oxidoreductase